MKKISVVLPAYNEEENIRPVVNSINKFLAKNFSSYEIIVVNDGSLDKTGKVVSSLIKHVPNLRLVTHEVNKGYGATLRSGFSSARGELIFYTDSDGQFDIHDLTKLIPLIKHYDIVAGYRINHNDPLMRILVSHAYNIIISLLLGLRVKDIDCSFKLYKRTIFKNLDLKCETGLIDAEVLLKAQKQGFTIGQVGVRHFPRTKGKTIYEIGKRSKIFAFVHPKVPLMIFKEIFKYWDELS